LKENGFGMGILICGEMVTGRCQIMVMPGCRVHGRKETLVVLASGTLEEIILYEFSYQNSPVAIKKPDRHPTLFLSPISYEKPSLKYQYYRIFDMIIISIILVIYKR
jgi:hypothetical protein